MIAIEKGYVTAGQVLEALNRQIKEQSETGQYSKIGNLLSKMGAITLAQYDEVIKEMEKHK